MNTIRTCGERHIQPVIDQHARAVWPRQPDGTTNKFAQLTRRQIRFTNLNELTPGFSRQPDGLQLCLKARALRRFGAVACGGPQFSSAAETGAAGDQVNQWMMC